ncbi:MAG: four helix bundle protein [Pseudomonadota bacterium]
MCDEKKLSFRDLEPWQLGMDLAERVHGATAAFPEEGDELGSRMRDAAITIPAAISEAFALESTEHVIEVMGPIAELETCVELAKRLQFLAEDLAEDLSERVEGVAQSIGKVLEEVDPELEEDGDFPGRPRPEAAHRELARDGGPAQEHHREDCGCAPPRRHHTYDDRCCEPPRRHRHRCRD